MDEIKREGFGTPRIGQIINLGNGYMIQRPGGTPIATVYQDLPWCEGRLARMREQNLVDHLTDRETEIMQDLLASGPIAYTFDRDEESLVRLQDLGLIEPDENYGETQPGYAAWEATTMATDGPCAFYVQTEEEARRYGTPGRGGIHPRWQGGSAFYVTWRDDTQPGGASNKEFRVCRWDDMNMLLWGVFDCVAEHMDAFPTVFFQATYKISALRVIAFFKAPARPLEESWWRVDLGPQGNMSNVDNDVKDGASLMYFQTAPEAWVWNEILRRRRTGLGLRDTRDRGEEHDFIHPELGPLFAVTTD